MVTADKAEHLAYAMYQRQAATYADPALLELAWRRLDVRAFWLAEAVFVMGVLG